MFESLDENLVITPMEALHDEEVIAEPPTGGRVILHTTSGPLEMELWTHEAPLSCRNFIQLCLEGYYEGVPFHRLVPSFLIQGGDPGGSGMGGEAAINPPPPLEISGQLKWTRRGLVGAVAMNTKEQAELTSRTTATGPMGSQFFITLAATPELYRRATLFGRIVGNTIYNLVRMSELPKEPGTDRFTAPLPHIMNTQVIINPFDDIIPRELVKVQERRRQIKQRQQEIEDANKKASRPAVPAVGLKKKALSFAEEEEEEEGDGETSKSIKSLHESIVDSRLSRQTVIISNEKQTESTAKRDAKEADNSMAVEEFQQLKKSRADAVREQIARVKAEIAQSSHVAVSPPPPSPSETNGGADTAKLNSLKRLVQSARIPSAPLPSSSVTSEPENLMAYKERQRQSTGQRTAMDEMDTLLALNAFRDKLRQEGDVLPGIANRKVPTTDKVTPTPAPRLEICKLHGLVCCESCRDTFGVAMPGDVEGEEGWLLHRLVFDQEAGYRDARVALDQLQVIDPRDRAQQFGKKK